MREKNILLTTLGHFLLDRQTHGYFYFDNGREKMYCDAISIPEAGAKYILAREHIDEIIVIGDGATCEPGDEIRPIPLSDLNDYSANDINEMSEYAFFRYRLSQYRDNIDLEGLDVLESGASIEKARGEELAGRYSDFCDALKKLHPEYQTGMEFCYLSEDKSLVDLLYQKMGSLSDLEVRWLKRYAYTAMSKDRKLRPLDSNTALTVSFIPTELGESGNIENIPAIVRKISLDVDCKVNLYMDMQSMGSSNGFILISLLSTLSKDENRKLSVREIITTQYDGAMLANPIDNSDKKRYDISSFISGINAFVEYGKVSIIREYWESCGIACDRVDSMLQGMSYVDAGISLCNIDTLEMGVKKLRDVFSTPTPENLPQLEADLFAVLEQTIRDDYGKLLETENGAVSMIELARWSYRKRFYQQTLTVIESRVPDEMAAQGLLYYAKDEDSKKAAVKALKIAWLGVAPYMRWQFEDMEHYFIKTYNRGAMDSVRPGSEKDKVYAHCRALSLTQAPEENMGFMRAYSMIDDKPELLEKLLLTYYETSKVRNKLNHSASVQLSQGASDDPYHIELLESVKNSITRFFDVYQEALDAASEKVKTDGKPEILKVTLEDLKACYISDQDLPKRRDKRREDRQKTDGNRKTDDNRRTDAHRNTADASVNIGGREIHIHIHIDH